METTFSFPWPHNGTNQLVSLIVTGKMFSQEEIYVSRTIIYLKTLDLPRSKAERATRVIQDLTDLRGSLPS